jgi:hypothetical protein
VHKLLTPLFPKQKFDEHHRKIGRAPAVPEPKQPITAVKTVFAIIYIFRPRSGLLALVEPHDR